MRALTQGQLLDWMNAIREALAKHTGNVCRAAAALGIPPRILYWYIAKAKAAGLEVPNPNDFRPESYKRIKPLPKRKQKVAKAKKPRP